MIPIQMYIFTNEKEMSCFSRSRNVMCVKILNWFCMFTSQFYTVHAAGWYRGSWV